MAVKKYKIKDADGEEFIVTEADEETGAEQTTEPAAAEAVVLTAEEISWLKAFIASQKVSAPTTTDEDKTEAKTTEEEQTVVTEKTNDSIANSVGARKPIKANDSITVNEDDADAVWQKRYDEIFKGGR